MLPRNLKKIQNFVIAFMMMWTTTALALDSDEQQNLTIASDSADINRLKGTAMYYDNVVIDRGTTHATGDKVTTHNDNNNKLHEAIIESFNKNISHFKTLTELDKPALEAEAKTIKFYPEQNRIVFLGNAKITQGTDSIQGEHLEYDMLNQRLVASNQQTPHDTGNTHRTVIVIAPNSDSSFMQPTKARESS
jgi:lipopolysaccharide export system protein LptA